MKSYFVELPLAIDGKSAMNRLCVFAKYWEPGQVKTRLAATVGQVRAASIYKSFLTCTFDRFVSIGDKRDVCISPPDREAHFREFIGNRDWGLCLQSGGDLGERMSRLFEEKLSGDSKCRLVLIGSDSPDLPHEYVEEAFVKLANHDVVLGPSDDGGYYLVGQSVFTPEMFRDIDWGTEHVWEQTISAFDGTTSSWFRLPSWSDVDDVSDLERLKRSLSNSSDEALVMLRKKLTAESS